MLLIEFVNQRHPALRDMVIAGQAFGVICHALAQAFYCGKLFFQAQFISVLLPDGKHLMCVPKFFPS